MSSLAKLLMCFVPASLIFGALPCHAQDARADYLGPWKQVHSNAGRCDRCEIVIDNGPNVLTVTANNGWSAKVRLIGSGNKANLQGRGSWAQSVSKDLRGRSFEMRIDLVGDELHLEMKIANETSRPRLIKGEFLKHWIGS